MEGAENLEGHETAFHQASGSMAGSLARWKRESRRDDLRGLRERENSVK